MIGSDISDDGNLGTIAIKGSTIFITFKNKILTRAHSRIAP